MISDQAHGTTARHAMLLQVWLSPSFPVGSFAYSHGLEWAVGGGRIHDRASALAWLSDLLDFGAMRSDAILLGEAWRAVADDMYDDLAGINELALAMAGARERAVETTLQGNAFMTAIAAAWPCERLALARGGLSGDVSYPVAIGSVAAAHGIRLQAVTPAFLVAAVQSLVSVLVRLAVIGQTDGQRVVADLAPSIEALATAACELRTQDLGGAAFLSDIAAMAHETQETRMFRT